MDGLRVVVIGRVQRVGFRAYVRDLAERHGVVGSVWNRTDGAVELEAAHRDRTVLDAFLEDLRDGPGRVARLDVTPVAVLDDDFRIRATRSPL